MCFVLTGLAPGLSLMVSAYCLTAQSGKMALLAASLRTQVPEGLAT